MTHHSQDPNSFFLALSRVAFAVALLAAALLPQPAAAYPAAGRDAFDSLAIISVAVPALNFPETPFTAVGPTRIRRGDPYDPGDGRIKIDVEIEAMVLTGETPLGPAVLRVMTPAPGCVQQKVAGVDFPATSWFDVRVEILIESPFGNIEVFSDPATPVRMMAMIDDLPPLDAQYQPDETFVGVNLVDGAGNVVGSLSHVGHFPGQQPTFSVAPDGPSALDPSDLFKRATAPAIRAAQLGLTSGNVDGLSYGQDFVFTPFPQIIDVRFSVAEGSVGVPGSHVAREAAKSPPQAHGDEFRVSPFFGVGGGTNVQVLDEDGDTAPPFPLQISDDLDALTEQPPSFVDDGDGVPEGDVFFSLSAGSPELASLSANGASILQSSGGGAPTIFLTEAELGLTPSDDIDAFCLHEPSKSVIFSLAPGSPSLGGDGPADLFIVAAANGSFSRLTTAATLGLNASDNVNALKCHLGEVPTSWNGKLSMDVLEDGEFSKRIEIGCHLEILLGAFDGDEFDEEMLFFFSQILCAGEDDAGPVRFTRRMQAPYEPPRGSAFRSTGGGIFFSFPLSPLIDGWGATGLHGPSPLSMFGIAERFPWDARAASDSSLLFGKGAAFPEAEQAQPYALFLEGGIPTRFAIQNVLLEFEGREPPSFTPEGFTDAAGFGPDPALGALASLFGTYSSPLDAAGVIPLPRRLGQNVQVLFDSGAPIAALQPETGGPQQAAPVRVPAPLLFVSPAQLNFQVPWEAQVDQGMVTATVVIDGNSSIPIQLPIAPTSPGIFTADFGAGRAIAINSDGTLAQPVGSIGLSHPTAPGDFLVILATGLGETVPPGVTGANSFDPDGNFIRRDTAALPRVLIGGVEGQVAFSGLSPEFVGVNQLNVQVPAGVAPGDAVPLVIEIGGRQSRADVTIAVSAAP